MDEAIKKFSELSERFGPQVYDAAMMAVRVEAISTLFAGALCLVASAGLFFVARWLWRMADEGADEMIWVPFGLVAAACGTLFIAGAWQVIDPWIYAALNYPEAWMAKKVFNL